MRKVRVLEVICAECGAVLDKDRKPPVLAKAGEYTCSECGAALEIAVMPFRRILTIRTEGDEP
jgi:DNA-directed RNA polymerase subunit RPC12/RpoP